MKKYGLDSNYTVKQYKVHKGSCNEDKIKNDVNRVLKEKSFRCCY